MLRKRQEIHLQAHQLIDAFLLAVSLYLAYQIRELLGAFYFLKHLHPFSSYIWLYLISLPMGPYLLEKNGFYNQPSVTTALRLLWPVIKSIGLCVLMAIAIMYVFQEQQDQLSRTVLVVFGVVGTLLLFVKQLVWQYYTLNYLTRNARRRTVALVGSHT